MPYALPPANEPVVGQVYDARDGSSVGPAQLSIAEGQILVEFTFMNSTDTPAEKLGRARKALGNAVFVNTDYRVSLTGCEFLHNERNYGARNHGRTRFSARAAIAAGPSVMLYSEINGVRSEIVGLPAWARRSSVTEDHKLDEDNRIKSITVTAESRAKVEVGGPLGLSLAPYFHYQPRHIAGEYIVTESVLVETRSESPRDWHDHLEAHRRIQELMALAYWWPCRMRATTVLRTDDPEMTMANASIGEKWRAAWVVNPGRPEVSGRDQLPRDRQPLFWLDDIGIDGLRRWLTEYDEFGRPVWILAASLYQQHQVVEPRLLQVGAALEALGYHLAAKHNQLPGGRQQFHFTDALKTICDHTDCDLEAVTGADRDAQTWCSDFNRVYKGVKHADNPLPDPAEAFDLTERGVRLARLWLARHLGVDRGNLESRVGHMA